MTFDDDPLDYGYLLKRLPAGDWWHLHFGRARVGYHCKLLGRQTKVFACIQHFAPGGVARSSQYVLTLDGEGVELSLTELRLDFRWGREARDE